MKIQIIVAHHLQDSGPPLPDEYLKVCSPAGLIDATGFHETFNNLEYFKQPNPVWGEVIPLLKANQSQAEITGLFHYRRFIIPRTFLKFETINLDFRMRERVAYSLLKKLRKSTGQVYVPKALDLSRLNQTVYSNFESTHFDSISLLHLGAAKLQDHFKNRGLNVDILELLRTQTKLHSCNIVIAPADVFERWRNALLGIVEELDRTGPEKELVGYQSRWGGFVIERLFSTWISIEKEHFGLRVEECSTILFHEKLNIGMRYHNYLGGMHKFYLRIKSWR
jgi:hypothetical protein